MKNPLHYARLPTPQALRAEGGTRNLIDWSLIDDILEVMCAPSCIQRASELFEISVSNIKRRREDLCFPPITTDSIQNYTTITPRQRRVIDAVNAGKNLDDIARSVRVPLKHFPNYLEAITTKLLTGYCSICKGLGCAGYSYHLTSTVVWSRCEACKGWGLSYTDLERIEIER